MCLEDFKALRAEVTGLSFSFYYIVMGRGLWSSHPVVAQGLLWFNA